MKILAIAATPFFSDRGCHIRIYNEAKYLKKLGADVRLCTYHIGSDIPEVKIRRIGDTKCYKKISPGFSWGKIWLDLKLLFLVRREILSFRPDAIHAHLYEGLTIGYLAKKLALKKIPIVFDLQGDIEEEFRGYNQKNTVAGKFFVWLSKKIVRWPDKIVVSSENVRVAGEGVEIIRDGIDLGLFSNMPALNGSDLEKIDVVRKWKATDKLLVYIGGLSDNKGVGTLLELFLSPVFKDSGWKLLLGGYGTDEGKYKNFIDEHKLKASVYLAGKVPYFFLPHYLALADAGIDPKIGSSESSGKLVNYMAAGIPVICFENAFNRSRLKDRGHYLKSIEDLYAVLQKIEGGDKIDYDLNTLDEKKEARKLYKIFQSVIKS